MSKTNNPFNPTVNPAAWRAEMRSRTLSGVTSMTDLLAIYTQEHRLMELDTPLGADVLLMERFEGTEAVNTLYEFKASCLSDSLYPDLKDLIGKQVDVSLKVADGGKRYYSGYVTDFSQTGSDGGFARYKMIFVPWLWLLTRRRDSWVFQDKSVIEIIEEVFADYPQANYRLDLAADYPRRSYCLQYRETDYSFITRLLAEEGISFTFEFIPPAKASEGGAHPTHAKLIIADHNHAYAEDPSSAQGTAMSHGIRYHRAHVTEATDGILAFGGERKLQTNQVRLATWDYKSARATQLGETTNHDNGDVPNLIAYDSPGPYYYADSAEGTRYATLRIQALEARNKTFIGEGSVRSFSAGTWFELIDHPVHDRDNSEDRQFLILSVSHEAQNNLPDTFKHVLTSLFKTQGNDKTDRLTYRNHFTCLRREVVYRPIFDQATHPKPTVLGPQTALVVGPAREEIFTDDQHRIKVQFHWQRNENRPNDERASCWMRVASSMAGTSYGGNQIPRIGQEVVVSFLESDIDRPVVSGRVYNGADQPAWHAPGIISGYKSKEYHGSGYNQFVMDDATGQLRTALHTTSQATQLNLGYLIDQQGNTRGNARGHGFELRSDAFGALRAARGLYLTTHGRAGAASQQQDAREATSQIEGGLELAKSMSEAAGKHNADILSVNGEVQTLMEISEHKGPQGNQQVQQFKEPILAVGGAADVALTTDQSTHFTAGEHLHLVSGEDTNLASGKSAAIAVKDAASLFAQRGAVKLYAGKGPISIQSQGDEMQLIADRSVTVSSVNDHITVAAKDHILLTAGGAYIRLSGGNIDIHAPGNISIKGATHDFAGPARLNYAMPVMPISDLRNTQLYSQKVDLSDFIGMDPQTGKAVESLPYEFRDASGRMLQQGQTNDDGDTQRVMTQKQEKIVLYVGDGDWKLAMDGKHDL